ncbi:MAG: M50 family metallopeptidase [Nocardioidaceae bacterium]
MTSQESQPGERPPRPPGTLRVGQIGGVDVLVRSSWLIVAAMIAFLLAPRIDVIAPGLGEFVYVAGLAFAVLLYLSVLLHEISHALMAQAFGFDVRSVTLHFLGGVTEIEGEADTAFREFWIAIVGPLTSLAVAAGAWALTFAAPDGLLLFACEALAFANLTVGILNLLPGLPLDGGRVFRAFAWAVTGRPFLATRIAGWSGRVLAVLALGYPFVLEEVWGVEPTVFDYVIAVIIAFFLWSGATQAIVSARVRQKLPNLRARALARRALGVPEEMPLSEAVRRAHDAQAGGIVVLGRDGRPRGIVNERAVLATPDDRRPWMSAGSVARRLEPGLSLQADLAGEDLVRALQSTPASEYVLLDADGSLFGVLVTKDVDHAFAQV